MAKTDTAIDFLTLQRTAAGGNPAVGAMVAAQYLRHGTFQTVQPEEVREIGRVVRLLVRGQEEGWSSTREAVSEASDMIRTIGDALSRGERDAAIDIVYDRIDGLLLRKQFDAADISLRAIIQNDLPIDILISALTVTLPFKAELRARQALITALRSKAWEVGGAEKAEAVLNGLT